MPLGFQHAIFIEVVDCIEETSVLVPLGKGGIESLREEITPALNPALATERWKRRQGKGKAKFDFDFDRPNTAGFTRLPAAGERTLK
jgi:hypothetical protein